ncbi:ATPase [Hymenobacter gummosus]|uniref:ATPase n=1 Tax=Hymenobacter gummosus TaxID=1776032 RepID=A0A3S0J8D6_9BACT|nr:SRPBCC domain-containing protein [Hymenobacter gummosus]RTQ47819.1 ATPase [Hymenobacter gummosus]
MERKTNVEAVAGTQNLLITREFDLPVALLFRAYTEPALIEQWMGTRVLKLENRAHGSWQYETADAQGQVVFRAGGVIHDFQPGHQITRTFEMEHAPFSLQLELLEFEPLSEDRSRLRICSVFRSVADRDQMLRLPFARGLGMAHNRLQALMTTFA